MSTTAHGRARPFPQGAPAASSPDAVSAAAVAWIALLPCTIVAVAGIALLGPPLGHALFTAGSDELWPPGWWEATGHPEPAKHGRYLLAALAPLLLAAVVLASARRELRVRPPIVRALAFTSQAAVSAFVVAFLVKQHLLYNVGQPAPPIFGIGTAVAAASLVLATTIALRRRAAPRRRGSPSSCGRRGRGTPRASRSPSRSQRHGC